MGTFVTGNVALPPYKIDATPPQGNPAELDAGDINFLRDAVGDLRDHTAGWINVKAYGAKGDNATDDTTAILAAMSAAQGKALYFPDGTYLCASALVVNRAGTRIYGAGKLNTKLQFTGATDGIVISDIPGMTDIQVESIGVSATNAGAGKALNANTAANFSLRCTFRDIAVLSSGSGRWAYGFYAANFQTSNIYGLHIYQSATVGIHLDQAADALNFYDFEVVGSTGAGTITRAIEIVSDADSRFYGGTLQGWFTQSLININTTVKGQKFYGLHLENTNASPSDGADVVGVGTNVNTTFSGLQGGSFNIGSAGTWRTFILENSEVGNVTIGAGCVAGALLGVRAISITDNSVTTTILACSSSTGLSYGSKISAALGKHNTATIQTISGTAIDSSAGLALANDATLDWLDSTGASKEVLRLSAANQALLTYPAASQLTIRNNTPTNKVVLNDTALALQSTLNLTLGSTTFAALGTPVNGTVIYCTDAVSPSSPATGGGTGALCVRQNGIWKAL